MAGIEHSPGELDLDDDLIADGGEPPLLGRHVLISGTIVWSLFFLIGITRSALTGEAEDCSTIGTRAATSLCGVVAVVGIYQLLYRFGERNAWKQLALALLLVVPACLAVGLITQIVYWFLSESYRQIQPVPVESRMYWFDVSLFVWIFIAWCGIYATLFSTAMERERDKRLARIENAINTARLQALQHQINPHFLFNTLNTLSGLVVLNQKREAEELILGLSAFLRYTLSCTETKLVSLEQELLVQRQYLNIEQSRLGDRLDVKLKLDDACIEALVPPLILQPLVENAVKHGVAPSDSPVCISIGARRQDEQLHLWVAHTPTTATDTAPIKGLGIGLSNVRRRLAAMYGRNASFETSDSADAGWRSLITLPWTQAAKL